MFRMINEHQSKDNIVEISCGHSKRMSIPCVLCGRNVDWHDLYLNIIWIIIMNSIYRCYI